MLLNAIDEYRLIDELGNDGASALFRAEKVESGELVLVRLYESTLDPSTYVPDLEWRTRVLPSWSEPDVVYITGWGATESGQPYLIMPDIPGRTLAAYFSAENKLALTSDAATALHFVYRLMAALHAGLRLGIVHKDLQPNQIMVRPDESPALLGLDLPEALTVEEVNGHSIWRYYHSPEQQQEKAMDARSNIYSLGVLLYDLLGGATARRSDQDPLPPLELLHPGLSEEVYQLVDKSTQEEEWLRYSSYDELQEALNAALLAEGGEPIVTPAPLAATLPVEPQWQPAGTLSSFIMAYWQPLLVLMAVLIFLGAIIFSESRQPSEPASGEGTPPILPAGGDLSSPTPTPEETGTRSTAGGAAGADATTSPTPTSQLSPTISATPTLPPTPTLLPPLPTATITPTNTTAPPTATNTPPPPPPPTATPTAPPPTATNTPQPTSTEPPPPPPPPPQPTATSEPPPTATEAPPLTATPPVPTVAPDTPTPVPPTPTAPPPGVRE